MGRLNPYGLTVPYTSQMRAPRVAPKTEPYRYPPVKTMRSMNLTFTTPINT